jgi:hypothetical protein
MKRFYHEEHEEHKGKFNKGALALCLICQVSQAKYLSLSTPNIGARYERG